jgi:hypothetical protein
MQKNEEEGEKGGPWDMPPEEGEEEGGPWDMPNN